MGSFQYLKPENIVEVFKTSQQYTEALTDGFLEYERIARNKPHGSIPKELPKTTDGTTASIIRKSPHRVIQQLPTGKVKSDTNDWLSIVAEFIYTHKIIPNANEDFALLQKSWNVVERFLTFGYCPTYAPFVEHGGYFCTDLRLPYWGDIFIQPGKLSDTSSNYIFMRSWWQVNDIDALIAAQEGLSKDTEKTWDVAALKQVKELVSTKDDKAKTPAEREKNVNTKGGVELITGFQRGVGAKFYTFHLQNTTVGDKKVTQGTIVRTKVNKDPRGELPISFAYGDIDGSNPFGRSIIELVGGMQNLMDGEMQMYQFNRAVMLAPPIIKRGVYNKNTLKMVPNAIWDLGTDPANSAETAKIDSTALANFSNNYGLMKSQLLNLLASPDTSVSAEVGNPGFSKTDSGVKQNAANVSVDDNYVRKQFETWFERWSETAINLYFAERTGIEELQLNNESANKLRKLPEFSPGGEVQPDGMATPPGELADMLTDDNKLRIDYDTATEALRFEVDASTSKMQDEVKQLQSLDGLTELLDKSPILQQFMPPDKIVALWNSIVANSGIEDPEKLTISEQEVQTMLAERQAQEQAQMQAKVQADAQAQAAQQMPQQGATPEGAPQGPPPEQPQQPQVTPEDQQFIGVLQEAGASDQQIGQALAMLHNNVPPEQIMQMLVEGQDG